MGEGERDVERAVLVLFVLLITAAIVVPIYAFLRHIDAIPPFAEMLVTLNTYSPLISALAALAVAGFTWMLWWSTNQLWEANRTALRISESAYLSTNRPQIRIKHVYFPDALWGESPIDVKLVIVNAGLTPAIITSMNVETLVLFDGKRLPPRPHFSQPDRAVKEALLAPGMTLALTKWTVAESISHVDFASVIHGVKRLYCYGFVEYVDVERRIRKTAFCRVWEPPRGAGSGSEPGRLNPVADPDYEYQD